jgi:hypothetical protein
VQDKSCYVSLGQVRISYVRLRHLRPGYFKSEKDRAG